MSETPDARLSPREQWLEQNKEADAKLSQLVAATTQREWLIITTALDRTRREIGADTGLTLLAGAWLHEKRAHGGASWDRLLDMTDDQLATLLGFPEGELDEQPTSLPPTSLPPAPNADAIADAAIAKPLGDSSAQNDADASTSAQGSAPA